MRIRMLVGVAGVDFSLSPGDETERFPADEAARMIAAGYAVPVVAAPIERAIKRAAREQRA